MNVIAIIAFLISLAAAIPFQEDVKKASVMVFGNEDRVLLLNAIAEVESTWRTDARSPTNAKGLMQFTSIARKQVGITEPRLKGFNPDDPKKALFAAAVLLKHYKKQFFRQTECEGWRRAIVAYNVGDGSVRKAIRLGGKNWLKKVNKSGRNYIKKVSKAEKEYFTSGEISGKLTCT